MDADFDIGDILHMMETDLNTEADTYIGVEAEEEMKNERFGHVSDDEIQHLIDSQTN
jgi:hypothetical protein